MIRKIIYTVSLCFVLFGMTSGSVSAHVYLTVGPMEIFSHIDPDDDPIVGEQARLFFIFAHADNKFDSKLCDCTATVKTNAGKELYSTKLFKVADPSVAEFDYTFADKGIYDIEITGKPLAGASFEAFEAHRILRVERTAVGTVEDKGRFDIGYILLFSIAFLVIAVLFIFESLRSKRIKNKGSSAATFIVAIAALSILALSFHEVRAMELVGQMDCHETHECCKILAVQDAPLTYVNETTPLTGIFQSRLITSLCAFTPSADVQNKSPPRSCLRFY
jgi:hypothetical protein